MHILKPVPVILDTDMGPDCDDAGALAILHALAKQEESHILGVMHCTSNPYGVGCIDAINRFYDRPDIPVGTLRKEGFLTGPECERYNRYIAENYDNAYRCKPAPNAAEMYRKILAGQPDGSVVIISIGPLCNLADLLETRADRYSPLDGVGLVSSKVRKLVLMAGWFESDKNGSMQPEWNVLLDIPSAQAVLRKWSSPAVFCGFEVGEPVITGKELMRSCGSENPVRKAYELYTEGKGRSSWDLITVLIAVRGDCGLWEISRPGEVCIDESGISYFKEIDEGMHEIVKNKAPVEKIEQYIEALLTMY